MGFSVWTCIFNPPFSFKKYLLSVYCGPVTKIPGLQEAQIFNDVFQAPPGRDPQRIYAIPRTL